ncbi:zona pellucida sperm-binding protein 4-like [Centropristis striata]|uniref:zona pellucida sperm-binding protein 4-like n=1 Tax=Centropristis striata TaxID=184440 RepID=UPI0027E151DA|nr:zona pellucida sperm-binding protein 4-like [Centropristis striata]
MAGVRAELLLALVLLLTGTLLLVPVRGWTHINETQLISLFGSGVLSQSELVSPAFGRTDDGSDSGRDQGIPEDDSSDSGRDEGIPEEEIPKEETFEPVGGSPLENLGWGRGFLGEDDLFNPDKFEVDAPPRGWITSEDGELPEDYVDPPPRAWESNTDGGFQVEYVEPPPRTWNGNTDGGFQVEYIDSPSKLWDNDADDEFDMEIVEAPPRSWTSHTTSSSGLQVACSEAGFKITLPGSLSDVKVLGTKELLPVMEARESCGYEVDSLRNTLTVPFTGCNVKHTDGYSLQLLYVDELGQTQVSTASCKESPSLLPRTPTGKPKSKCDTISAKAQNCAVASGERVPCGQTGISSIECEKLGCCVDSSTCFYPLDECTGDQHFVFAVRHDGTPAPVDPTKLVIPGHPNCKPAIVNAQVAIFKFKVTECGARAYVVGETKIYLAEVQSVIQALNLKYGAITRSDPLRFFVECRYSKSGGTAPGTSLASIGYLVKTPTSVLPSTVSYTGLYGVALKIATDQTYSTFLANDHAPLSLLLGKPVYLELRLKSPKPDAVVLVNYCLAYPRSAKNALVLVYEGCANPYDPSVSVLQISGDPKVRNKRRFVVKAFQFMDQKTNKYLNEEIYFMCSTEVCRTTEKTCPERCFDGNTP